MFLETQYFITDVSHTNYKNRKAGVIIATSQRNLSNLGFEDFFRLKYQTEEIKKQQVTDVVAQHNKDKVSYIEAYEVLMGIVNDISYDTNKVLNEAIVQEQRRSNISLDLTGTLIEKLISNKIITKQDESDILNSVQKLYKAKDDNSGKKN